MTEFKNVAEIMAADEAEQEQGFQEWLAWSSGRRDADVATDDGMVRS